MARSAQADVKLARKALKAVDLAAHADPVGMLRADLCENLYPIMESLSRLSQRMAEELLEVDGAVAELVESEDSYVTPELGDLISAALTAGGILHAELVKLLPAIADDLQKKRIEDALKSYARSAEIAWGAVLEAAEGDDEEGEEEEEEEDGEEGDDTEEHEDLTEQPVEEEVAAASADEEATNV